jgi:hypothetical protein
LERRWRAPSCQLHRGGKKGVAGPGNRALRRRTGSRVEPSECAERRGGDDAGPGRAEDEEVEPRQSKSRWPVEARSWRRGGMSRAAGSRPRRGGVGGGDESDRRFEAPLVRSEEVDAKWLSGRGSARRGGAEEEIAGRVDEEEDRATALPVASRRGREDRVCPEVKGKERAVGGGDGGRAASAAAGGA